jgi:hypothetical protein
MTSTAQRPVSDNLRRACGGKRSFERDKLLGEPACVRAKANTAFPVGVGVVRSTVIATIWSEWTCGASIPSTKGVVSVQLARVNVTIAHATKTRARKHPYILR